jgi:hypothetical protein
MTSAAPDPGARRGVCAHPLEVGGVVGTVPPQLALRTGPQGREQGGAHRVARGRPSNQGRR